MTTTPTGLQYEDTVPGSGETARAGHHVTVHYTGWLHDADAPQGRGAKFDSSKDRDDPFDFPLGGGRACRSVAPACSPSRRNWATVHGVPAA
jgi:FKBP-type peptidyl-prolyl cis-trans isomerase FkpA